MSNLYQCLNTAEILIKWAFNTNQLIKPIPPYILVGHSVIDWLERWSIIRRRDDGVAMAQTLLKLGHIQEVDILDGAAGAARKFVDGNKLYRFVCLQNVNLEQ